MEIKIAGWQKLSLIDYPGKMAAVIFLAGCNMRCHYCHNRHIWCPKANQLSFAMVFQALQKRADWLDAVVVSGGEPTLSPFLIPLLKKLRTLGLLIKLDTNGTRPDIVRMLVESGLVDFVALDIKAPPEKYPIVTGVSITPVLKTAQFLKMQNYVSYMFRTTVSPLLDENDLILMGKKFVCGALCWQIQQCRVAGAYSAQKIKKMALKLKPYTQNVVVTGI